MKSLFSIASSLTNDNDVKIWRNCINPILLLIKGLIDSKEEEHLNNIM